MLNRFKFIITVPLVFSVIIVPHPTPQPASNTIGQYLSLPSQPQFPNMETNYTKTVVEPQVAAQRAAEAQAREEAEQPPLLPTYAPVSDAKLFIYIHESGNNPSQWNTSGCLGLGQACPASKLLAICPNQADYACQDAWFTSYMLSNYGTWENAKAMWLSRCGTDLGCWW